jgi:hypothetical protein
MRRRRFASVRPGYSDMGAFAAPKARRRHRHNLRCSHQACSRRRPASA